MIIKEIPENSKLNLEDKYIEILYKLKKDDPIIPFEITEKTISFNEYVVGEILIDDILIKIIPRNKAFDLISYFEIIEYINNPKSSILQTLFSSDGSKSFNLSNLSKEFINVLSLLLNFGISGEYKKELEDPLNVCGDIEADEFNFQLIPFEGVKSFVTLFTLDTRANQLIKKALVKLINHEDKDINKKKFQLFREIENISDTDFKKEDVNEIIRNLSTSNPYYFIALHLANKILFESTLKVINGNIKINSFLENSNYIFEKYIYAVLSNNLKIKIQKWDIPKEFCKFKMKDRVVKKSYCPDILINYDHKNHSALAVLDVKNKYFEPIGSNKDYRNLVSNQDLYQLIFYMRQLTVNIGGLIYPSQTNNDPIEMEIQSSENLRIFLISLNMKSNINERHTKFIKDINENILRYI